MRSISSQGSRGYTKLFAQGKPTIAAKNDTLAELLKIYNERGAEQADSVLMIIQENLKSSKPLSDLDFCIRSELGDIGILPAAPATTVVNSLADAIACWAQILMLEKCDALEARRLARLLVQYNRKCPDTEFPPQWIECAQSIASRSDSDLPTVMTDLVDLISAKQIKRQSARINYQSNPARNFDTKTQRALSSNVISQNIAGTADSMARMISHFLAIFLSSVVTVTEVTARSLSSPAGAEVMMDRFFNKWTRDAGSGVWTDEHGGRTFDSPKYITIKTLHTPDGRIWSYQPGEYWIDSRGELRRFRPAPSSEGWKSNFFCVWESNDGELTREWPSKPRRLPPATPTGAAQPTPETRFDRFFHVWTRAASGEWVDEYGGRTADMPGYSSSFEMHTADGKAWLWRDEDLWVSRGGECQRQQPAAGSVAAGEWSQQTVAVWTSSVGDLCLGWPSKVLQERQRETAARAGSVETADK